jgi:uncharacterized LabA/DUF88 family protein
LVDGFNVYHSLQDALNHLQRKGKPAPSTKWLDMHRLLDNSRHHVRGAGRVRLCGVYYFTALAHHIEQRKPGVVARHTAYIEALETTSVTVVLGRFKKANSKTCPGCKALIPRHEEKETDVNISVKLFELLIQDVADAIMIVSGDTDLIPAIRSARVLFPTKAIGCLFPFNRSNDELRKVCGFYASIGADQYSKFQLPDPVQAPGRRPIKKPPAW